MDLPNPFKLQKLTITAATQRTGTFVEDPSKRFEAMFNPAQYTVTYRNRLEPRLTLDPTTWEMVEAGPEPHTFSVTLVLDGTGATDFGLTTLFGLATPTVKDKVKKFLAVCYNPEEALHAANRIKVMWGVVDFTGFLKSVAINYTLFDQAGNPLRAELNTEFLADAAPVHLSSPDLTHTRTVRAGDTLPLLTKEIYGSSRHYLFVAKANQLKDFRNLKTGAKLHFPPLAT